MFARIVLILSVLTALAVSPARGAELRSASFIPHWLPQAQFAGYYMAQEKGLYRKHGIDLTILRGGPEYPPSETIARGKVTFATTFLSSALELRDRGVRLVNIGQIVQRSGFILVTKKASGINTPADLNGKKVGIWTHFRLQPQAFFRKYGIAVKPVHQGATMNLFLRDGVVAASAMWYNEYHALLNAGLNEDETQGLLLRPARPQFSRGRHLLPRGNRPAERRPLPRLYPRLARRMGVRLRESGGDPGCRDAAYPEGKCRNEPGPSKMDARQDEGYHPSPGGETALGVLKREDYLRVAGEMQRSGLIKEIPPYGEMYVDCSTPR